MPYKNTAGHANQDNICAIESSLKRKLRKLWPVDGFDYQDWDFALNRKHFVSVISSLSVL